MPKYIVTREADADINEILAYIALDNFDAAMALYSRFIIIFEMLAENTKAGQERPELKEDIRSFPEGSYIIFYRIWARQVAIIRVLHSARDLDRIFSLK